MSIAQRTSPTRLLPLLASAIAFAACFTPARAVSQAAPVYQASTSTPSLLPDAPGESSSSLPASSAAAPGAAAGQARRATAHNGVAGVYDGIIEPGETAPRLTVGNKVFMGFRDSVSPFAMIGWVASAVYSEAVNGSPNYGQDPKAFAQRLGAAAARNTSENLIAESILAPVLHEDPRYYKLGHDHHFVSRVVYAGTRAIITRTDGGHQTINLSLIGGNFGGAALTGLYYPPGNRNLSQVLQTFGGSMGGSALGYLVSEFIGSAGDIIHLKKQDAP